MFVNVCLKILIKIKKHKCCGLQQNSAADLSMLVLEVLEKSETKVEEEILGEYQLLTLKTPIHLHN